MNKVTYKLCSLSDVLEEVVPGDVIGLLNQVREHVAVLVYDEGVFTESGMFIKPYIPVRYPGINRTKFDLDCRFFNSEEITIDLDGESPELPVGSVILRFDRDAVDEGYEKIAAEILVIGLVDQEKALYITTDGKVIFFDDRDFIPAGVIYEDDEIVWKRSGRKKLKELGYSK